MAWWEAKRDATIVHAMAVAAARIDESAPRTVAEVQSAILSLECKDRLFPSDFQELDCLKYALRRATIGELVSRSV